MDIEELEKQLGISNNEDNQETNKELEDLINLLNSPEEDIINIQNDTEIFEGLSQDELDILMKQDEDIDIDDIDIDVINDISVYDEKEGVADDETLEKLKQETTENDNDDNSQNQEDTQTTNIDTEEMSEEDFLKFVEESKNKKSKFNKHSIIIISSIIFLVFLIVVTIIFFTVAIKKANNIIIQNEIKKDNLASKYTPKDKNTVYFDMAQNIDGETLILEKVHINQLNTTFYFKNKIEPMKYNIVLTDSNENLYPMDLNFIKDGDNEEYSILRFDSIIGDNRDLKLIFKSLATEEKAIFDLNFNANLEEEKITYINSKVKNNFGDYNININYAQFGDKSSRIDYTIEPNGDVKYKIYQGGINQTDYVKLKENDKYISPLANKPAITSIDDKVIGRMDFKNIKDKNGNVVLEFHNINKEYELNKTISLNDVKNGNIYYDFDKYRLYIEGMPKFDNKYVLVLHAEDTTISTENRPDDFNRIEATLNVELSAIGANGVEVIISPTEVKSAKYGTDIIFELDENQMSILNSISPNNILVNVKSILLKENPISIPLNLNRGLEREIISYKIMEEQITDSFKSRLENRNSINNIKGFSSEVLNNTNLMQEYTSLSNKKMKNAISIISKNMDNEYLEAIIQEAIQIKEDDEIRVIYKTHKIKANNVDNKWTIYSDEIIK